MKNILKKTLLLGTCLLSITGIHRSWAMSPPPPMMSVNVNPSSHVIGIGAPTQEGIGISLFTTSTNRSSLRMGTTDVDNIANEERTDLQTTLLADYPLGKNTTLLLAIPYINTDVSYTGVTQQVSGLGDITLFGKYAFYQDRPITPTQELSGIVGVAFPTGSTDEKDSAGALLSTTQQLGSDTTDFLLGGAGIWRFAPFSFYGDMTYTINGSASYKFGNQFVLNTGINYPLGPSFALVGEVNGRYGQQDSSDVLIGKVPNTGGTTLFLSPGVQWKPAGNWTLQLGVQLPVYQNFHDTQLAYDTNILFGISTRFGGGEKEGIMQ